MDTKLQLGICLYPFSLANEKCSLLHCRPCFTRPHSRDPQWSQNVGTLKLWTLNLWGMLMLKPWLVACKHRRVHCMISHTAAQLIAVYIYKMKWCVEHLIVCKSAHDRYPYLYQFLLKLSGPTEAKIGPYNLPYFNNIEITQILPTTQATIDLCV